jgi:ankyrin repeat protein
MPLHSAVAGQHLAISQLLIEHGADVNAVQADDFTPLQEAAQNGQIAMIDLLLDHGADCHAANQQGQTAYDIAQAHGHAEAAARLKRDDMRPYEI